MTLQDADNAAISVHHVGARSGASRPFLLPNCERDYAAVLYEADVESLDDLTTLTAAGDIVLPYCLGAIDGPGVLHINYCQYTSSLYPVTDRPEEITEFHDGYDYRISRAARTMEFREIRQRRIDSLAEIQDGRVPPPTALTLDTQGSEADIIRGAANTIRNHTLAVISEVELIEFYKDQPSFGDLARTLGDLDFLFVGFLSQYNTLTCRQPLGLRGPGFLTHGDVLFLRRICSVAHQPALLLKLGIVALSMGHVDYALEAWSQMPREILDRPPYANCSYGPLVRELLAAYDSTPHLYPNEFQDFYSWEDSRARFDPTAKARLAESLAATRRRIGESLLATNSAALITLCSQNDLPLEAVLRRHMLTNVANQVKSRRLSDIAKVLAMANLEIKPQPATA